MKNLHDYMKEAKDHFEGWQEKHPYDHPAKLHKLMADYIVDKALSDKRVWIEVFPTIIAGGVPEYSQAIASLRENGFKICAEKLLDNK